MTRHERILSLLDSVAETVEPVAAARIAAAIVYKKEVISIGTNRLKTDPFQSKFSSHIQAIYLHAENDAIKKALRVLSIEELAKSRLYISRSKFEEPTKKTMIRGLARPCAGCMRAIAAFDIKHVCFTTEEGYDWL